MYAGALWHAWRAHERRFLIQWMASLAALSVSFALTTMAAEAWDGAAGGGAALARALTNALSLVAGYVATAYLALGTRELLTDGFGRRRGARRIVVAIVTAGTISVVGSVAMTTALLREVFGGSLYAVTIALVAGTGGVAVYSSGRPGELFGRRLLGAAFLLYAGTAVLTAATHLPLLRSVLPPGVAGVAAVLDVVVLQVVGLCMLMTVLEYERRRATHLAERADVAAEEAATASAFLEAAVDSCLDSVHEIDASLRLTAFNAAFRHAAMDRCGREPVVGGVVTDLYPLSERAVWRARYERALCGTPLSFDLPSADHKNTPRVRHVRVLPIHRGATVVGVVVVSRDSTAERRLGEQLRANEDRAESVLAHGRELIITIGADGRARFVSPAVRAQLGWSDHDIIGRSVLMLVHDDDSEAVRQALLDAQTDITGVASVVFRLRHRGGGWVNLDARLSQSIAVTGEATIVINALDVTERTALEADLRRAQREATIGQLVHGVAHEFTNILTTIIGNVELGLLQSPSSLELTDIDVAARRGRSLIAQLQEFGGNVDAEPTVFTAGERVAGVNYLLLRLLGDDTPVETSVDDQEWKIQMGAGQFEQVLVNLAIAARDSAPAGSKLVVEVRARRVARPLPGSETGVPPGEYVTLSVVAGRPSTSHHSARHEQLSLGITDALGVADLIVQRAGGVLAAIPRDGLPTAYCAFLPRHREAPQIEPRRTDLAAAPTGSETILLAEDDPAIRSLTARTLRGAGYTVLESPNGRDAVQVARAYVGTINLVLSDVVMPEMNGTELVRQLRARREGLRAMLMSGYRTEQAQARQTGSDVHDFLSKPFTTGELLVRLRQTLDAAS